MAKANLYIPVYEQVAATALDRYSFIADPVDPINGQRIWWKKSGEIWAIYRVDYVVLRPACYLSYPEGGILDDTTIAPKKYQRHIADAYSEWTVPANAAGKDTIVAWLQCVVGGADFSISVNGDDTSVNIVTSHTETATLERSVVLPAPLADGDVLRITADANSARVLGLILIDSDGIPGASDDVYYTGTPAALTYAGSSVELAYSLKGGAQNTAAFVGGYAHQGGDYGTQDVASEVITVDGEAATLGGYLSGASLQIVRTSDLLDQSDAVTYGTLVETMVLDNASKLTYSSVFTAAIETIMTAGYSPMLPAVLTAETARCGTSVMDIRGLSGQLDFSRPSSTMAIYKGLPGDAVLSVSSASSSPAYSNAFVSDNSLGTYRKGYLSIAPSTIAIAGTVRSGWTWLVGFGGVGGGRLGRITRVNNRLALR